MAINCKKGTPCGGACIRTGAVCKKEFNPGASKALDNVKKKIGLGVKIRNAQRKGDASEEARLRVQREALSNQAKSVESEKQLSFQPFPVRAPGEKVPGLTQAVKDIFGIDPKEKVPDLAQKVKNAFGIEPGGAAKAKSMPNDLQAGKSAVLKSANAVLKAAEDRVKEVEERGVKAAIRKDDASFGRAVNELVVAKLQVEMAVLRKERIELLGDRNPTAVKRRAELADQIGGIRNKMNMHIIENEKPKKAAKSSFKGWTEEDRVAKERSAKFFDDHFNLEKKITGSKESTNWDETVKNAKEIGSGSFGTVRMSPDKSYVVKRGEVGANESALIKRVGEAGIGPKLLVGELGRKTKREYAVQLHDGRIAMTVVPGSPIGRTRKYTDTVGGVRVGEAYWKARADIHRLGIAHNDAHPENIFIDNKGKGRWVDMGLAQGFPKAALAEAMGVTPKPQGSRGLGQGDWQGARWRRQTGLNENLRPESDAPENIKQIQYNAKYNVHPFLRSKGLNDDDIAAIATHGIRQGKTTYSKGAWAKISDEDAMQAINLLYDGVE
jgi:hypothetical protein